MSPYFALPFSRLVGILLAMVLLMGFAPALVDTAEARSAGNVEHIARDLFNRLNDERRARGVQPVTWDEDLARAATTWSAQMSDTKDYRHSDMNATMAASPYREKFDYVGENIYLLYPRYESAGYAHRGWMRSDGHRRNMVNAFHHAAGIGIICDADGTMWATMNMGRYSNTPGPAYQESTPASPVVHDNEGGPTCREHNGTPATPSQPTKTSAPLQPSQPAVSWPAGSRMSSVYADDRSVQLTWTAASGQVSSYELLQGGKAVKAVGAGSRSTTVTGLTPSTTYRFGVAAVDAAGNRHVGPLVEEQTTRPPTSPPSGMAHNRLAGADRAATAVAVSQFAFPDGAPAAVLARADDFADALAGTPVAAAAGGPILLTPRGGLPAATVQELVRLGVETVYVMGGPGAVPDAVLAGVPATTQRVTGANRNATAAAAADLLARLGGRPGEGVYLADGRRGWPDAVSVSALAGFQGRPLLLTSGENLPAETAAALDRHNVGHATIVGGTGVVPAAVETAVRKQVTSVDRLAGDSRYATAAAVRDRSLAAGMDSGTAWITTLRTWPDSLVVGAAAAAHGASTIAVAGTHPAREPSDAVDHLVARGTSVTQLNVAGGQAAVWNPWLWEAFHRLDVTRPAGSATGGLLQRLL